MAEGRYNGDRPDLLDQIRGLQQRLSVLERTNQLTSASIGKGGLRVIGGAITIRDEANTIDIAVLSSEGITLNGADILGPGIVRWFAGPDANIPEGYLICDGTAVSRTTFADLFAAIGTTWGVGDGSTTFNLPSLRNRFPVGAGSSFPLGTTGGASTHTHTNPSSGTTGSHSHTNPNTQNTGGHSHAIGAGNDATVNVVTSGALVVSSSLHNHNGTGAGGSHEHTVGSTGSTGDHSHTVGDTGSGNNNPPYGALTPIIRF